MISLEKWIQFSEWLFRKRQLDKSQNSNYLSRFKFLCLFFDKKELSLENLTSYRDYVDKVKESPNTKNLYLNALRLVCRWQGIDFKDTLENFKSYPKLVIPLNEDEERKLLDEAYRRDYRYGVAIDLMLQTGLRIQEVANLKPEDIFSDMLVVKTEFSKNNLGRQVPIDASLYEKLSRLMKNKVLVFEGRSGGRLNEYLLNVFIEEIRKDLKINKPIRNHILRHSCGSSLHDEGVDIYTIKELFGHKSIQSTLNYVRVSMKRKREAIRRNPLLRKTRTIKDFLSDLDELIKQYQDTDFYPKLKAFDANVVQNLYKDDVL
jgi:integrase